MEGFLDAAARNLRRAASTLAIDRHITGCLLVAETRDDGARGLFRGGHRHVGSWLVQPAGDDAAIATGHESGEQILLIGGRQIATREGLEVLSLCCSAPILDGESARDTIERAHDHGAIVVVPWAFGKWWRKRGRIVRDMLTTERRDAIFLGDNGNRLAIGSEPRLFRRAEAIGMPVLPGSDPLPFPGEYCRVGTYGFVLDGDPSAAAPTESIQNMIRGLTASPPAFGSLSGLPRFLRVQVAMQVRKRVMQHA